MEKIELSNGVLIPEIGFGTFKISEGEVEELVLNALQAGYRHIDTATAYENEAGIGLALKKSKIKRKDLFITTKVQNEDQGYETTKTAFEKSLKHLQLDYIDLYLIHWPTLKSADTWRAIEELYEAKKIRAIGVSNFHEQHLTKLLSTAKIKPMINQIERHPFLIQEELYNLCVREGIALESWSPLAKGKIFQNEILSDIATRYKKTISQIVIRWQIQTGWITIPKSSSLSRMKENLDIYDFVIMDSDINLISSLNCNERTGSNPDDFKF